MISANGLARFAQAQRSAKKVEIKTSVANFHTAMDRFNSLVIEIGTLKNDLDGHETKDVDDLRLLYDPTENGVPQNELSDQLTTKVIKFIKDSQVAYFGHQKRAPTAKQTEAAEAAKKKAKVKKDPIQFAPKIFEKKPSVEKFVGFLTKKENTDEMGKGAIKKYNKLKKNMHHFVDRLLHSLVTQGTSHHS